MERVDIVALAISCAIGLLLVVMSLILLTGRGSFLIAGYNTASKEEKEKYDEKALCRFVGKILLPIGLCTPMVAIGGIYEIEWMNRLYIFGVIALSIFAVVYLNTGNRFRK